MFKLSRFFYLILVLSLPLTVLAIEAGDPDSVSVPLIVEPEANIPALNDDNEDNNVTQPEPLPGAHLVAPENGEAQSTEADKWHEMKFTRLQGLNKVTAKTSEIKANIGANTKFGNLEFTVEKCLRGPENEKLENTALFTIWDEIPGQEKKQIFRGWMFSSSPAISALEHPIYDIILLGCGEAPKVAASSAKPVDGKKTDSKTADKKANKKPKFSITVQ